MAGLLRHAAYAALLTALVAGSVGVPPGAPAAAQTRDEGDREQAEQMAREGMERILRALELFMDSIPQYELPEVNEHGDIIIRRKRRSEDGAPRKPEAAPDSTDT